MDATTLAAIRRLRDADVAMNRWIESDEEETRDELADTGDRLGQEFREALAEVVALADTPDRPFASHLPAFSAATFQLLYYIQHKIAQTLRGQHPDGAALKALIALISPILEAHTRPDHQNDLLAVTAIIRLINAPIDAATPDDRTLMTYNDMTITVGDARAAMRAVRGGES